MISCFCNHTDEENNVPVKVTVAYMLLCFSTYQAFIIGLYCINFYAKVFALGSDVRLHSLEHNKMCTWLLLLNLITLLKQELCL